MKKFFPESVKNQSKPDKFCPGCGHSILLKIIGQVIDEMKIKKNILFGVDIGCSLLAWDYFDVKTIQTHHGRTIPVVSGYKKVSEKDVGIAYVGDGGAYAIGLQSLIHSVNRNDPITVLIVNNTVYGMTGGQMAPTTLNKEITSTTLSGKDSSEKGQPMLGIELLKSLKNNKMYLSRVQITNPLLVKKYLIRAIRHQIDKNSFSCIEILSMCPTNWRKDARQSVSYVEKNMCSIFKPGEFYHE
jgi:2-oxoglutarate ferredoxin oxidoreductase subunit beta